MKNAESEFKSVSWSVGLSRPRLVESVGLILAYSTVGCVIEVNRQFSLKESKTVIVLL